MISLADIQQFLAPKRLAIAGASRNPKKFGGVVLGELKKKGYDLYPVHPEAESILDIPCYRSLDDVPEEVDHLYIVTPSKSSADLVQQAANRRFKRIWIQQGSETPEAIELARQNQIPLVSGKCILMFAEPVGHIHGFHRWLAKVFGAYPK